MQRNHRLERRPEDGHIGVRSTGVVAVFNRLRDKDASRMRRLAPLALLLVVSGCGQYAGNPFDGFPGFIADTHTIYRNPNRPVGDSDNMRRVLGQSATSEPLVPEPGNVWPGPIPPDLTLSDIEKQNNSAYPSAVLKPGDEIGIGRPLGSSTPPGAVMPGLAASPAIGPSSTPTAQRAPTSSTIATPNGPAVLNRSGSVQTYTDPKGGTGIVVPNGNGTSTLVAPDGSVQTVPTPR